MYRLRRVSKEGVLNAELRGCLPGNIVITVVVVLLVVDEVVPEPVSCILSLTALRLE